MMGERVFTKAQVSQPELGGNPETQSLYLKGTDMCHGQGCHYIGDGHPTFNRNPYNGYIIPYYWVDDHPLLYGNNGSLDPGTYVWKTPTKICTSFSPILKGQKHHKPDSNLAAKLLQK